MHYFFWGRLPFSKKIEVIFLFKNIVVFTCYYFWLFSFFEVVFHLKNKLRSSSYNKIIEIIFHFQNIIVFTFNCFGCIIFYERRLHLKKNCGRLPFSKKLRSSSFFKNIEVVFHISSSLVIIRLPTKNQPPRLPGTALIVISPSVVWLWCGFF